MARDADGWWAAIRGCRPANGSCTTPTAKERVFEGLEEYILEYILE